MIGEDCSADAGGWWCCCFRKRQQRAVGTPVRNVARGCRSRRDEIAKDRGMNRSLNGRRRWLVVPGRARTYRVYKSRNGRAVIESVLAL